MALRQCPDCGGALHQIVLVDKSHGEGHQLPEYRVPRAEWSMWTRKYPIQGQVLSMMCQGCARILLYGHDYRSAAQKSADADGRLSIASGPGGALSEPDEPG